MLLTGLCPVSAQLLVYTAQDHPSRGAMPPYGLGPPVSTVKNYPTEKKLSYRLAYKQSYGSIFSRGSSSQITLAVPS